MIGRAARGEGNGLPCFEMLVGWLLWGMRNAEVAEEPFEATPRNVH